MPSSSGEADQERSKLLRTVVRAMVVMGLVGFVSSLFDARNLLRVSFAIYVPIFITLALFAWLVRRGRLVLAGWAIVAFFWLIIAMATLLFGGLRGENASSFGVTAMLAAVVLSGRAGVVVAVISSAWCGLVAWLELHDALPTPLGPAYSPINAWSAFSVSLILMMVLMRYFLDSLQATRARAEVVQQRSIQAQKMELVGNLASGIAHDFNNLLTVIAGVSESLRFDPDPAEKKDLLADLDEAVARSVLMSRQLLSFGRSQPTEVKDVDIAVLVRSFGVMLPRLLGSRITYVIEAPAHALVRATQVGIEQVLLNLAVNARDAMPDGGQLSIRVLDDQADVRLLVTDTGIGMSAETQAHIFSPFFTTKTTGTGLGLATVLEKVTHFGGRVVVESQIGKGSTFEVRLLRAQRSEGMSEAHTTSTPTTADGQRARRILLVEDDTLVRRTLARLLEHEGFEVVPLNNGLEALHLLESPHTFACVLTDISMPLLDGEELANRLTVSAPTLPVILMSGNRAPAFIDGRRRFFLEKPVDHVALVQSLVKVCDAG